MTRAFQIRRVQPRAKAHERICLCNLIRNQNRSVAWLNACLTCSRVGRSVCVSYPLSANAGNGDFPPRLNRFEWRLEMQRGAQSVFPRPAGTTRARGCGIRARAGAGDSCRESDSTESYRVFTERRGQGEMMGYTAKVSLGLRARIPWGCSAFSSNPSCPLRYQNSKTNRYLVQYWVQSKTT